ncbi:hypothetical protein BDK51DRAFT_39296 [Blyttiomyces helicus]|uniref:Uncharacterized protein n=1 Tax=Blyttiomyces helicus TaxID=388810 RepID=A0A4P9W836_9FUNG|nr:hypothetical protein BDK51DRAFT_39296 [Blyttiomyces helicus]|eukprot:RKO88669.1 hypothetical protein BDK51DRAFT_39296 [Blyttiomyces helicus]
MGVKSASSSVQIFLAEMEHRVRLATSSVPEVYELASEEDQGMVGVLLLVKEGRATTGPWSQVGDAQLPARSPRRNYLCVTEGVEEESDSGTKGRSFVAMYHVDGNLQGERGKSLNRSGVRPGSEIAPLLISPLLICAEGSEWGETDQLRSLVEMVAGISPGASPFEISRDCHENSWDPPGKNPASVLLRKTLTIINLRFRVRLSWAVLCTSRQGTRCFKPFTPYPSRSERQAKPPTTAVAKPAVKGMHNLHTW